MKHTDGYRGEKYVMNSHHLRSRNGSLSVVDEFKLTLD